MTSASGQNVSEGADRGMAAVVEPIVTEEKLLALLGEQSEQSVLDYKAPLDLSKREEVVEFAKGVAAMRSNPDGGYIVIGADDRGTVVPGLTSDLARHFDEATLRPKLEKYLTAPEIHTACHQVDGHNVVLVYIAPAPNG